MRLIDADALMDDINELKKSPWYNNAFRIDFLSDINGSRVVRSEAIDIVQRLCIDDAPTIDAVEVVRCKDCKYEQQCRKAVEYITYEPTSVTIGYKSVDFCSYGERRTDEAD